tara:strand:+ start:1954 stop:2226 length:273 start_codon:yes stop_codon:yes gene_type:complete
MPYNLRSGKNTSSQQDKDTALILLKLHKDAADERIQAENELKEKKQELENLRLIKQYTDQYNTLTMLSRINQAEADRLEMEITRLISTIK